MLCSIIRTLHYGDKPCNEAYQVNVTYLDYRMASTIKEAKNQGWFKSWYDNGTNHREENGMVVCEQNELRNIWVINIGVFQELTNLLNKYKEIKIRKSDYKKIEYDIVVYY